MKSDNNPKHQKTNSLQNNTPTPSQVRIAQQPQTRHNELSFTDNPLPPPPVLPTITTTNSQATFNPLPPPPVLPTITTTNSQATFNPLPSPPVLPIRLMTHSQSTPNLLSPPPRLPTQIVTRSQSTLNMSRNFEIHAPPIDLETIMNEDINEHAEEILLKNINSLKRFFDSKKDKN